MLLRLLQRLILSIIHLLLYLYYGWTHLFCYFQSFLPSQSAAADLQQLKALPKLPRHLLLVLDGFSLNDVIALIHWTQRLPAIQILSLWSHDDGKLFNNSKVYNCGMAWEGEGAVPCGTSLSYDGTVLSAPFWDRFMFELLYSWGLTGWNCLHPARSSQQGLSKCTL